MCIRDRITTVIPDVMLIIAGLALASAENHVPSPRFGIPQNIQINYLGYEMNVPATIERLLGLGRPNVLWVGLAAVAIGTYPVSYTHLDVYKRQVMTTAYRI